ncbi:hypothetical protein C8F01DRAFT_1255138 [Mycena amicta]|nr:hypothetical protein C8F01DRAFT_1255138 [Mycena amicta]
MATFDDVSRSPDSEEWQLSSRSDSYETTSGSSSSTVPGPGELSGKAIKALGRVTIRGIDHFVIQRQLAVISSRFPLTDAAPTTTTTVNLKERDAEVREMYLDLLEFSRPGLYREEVNKKALRLLLVQIALGETLHLIRGLAQWDKLELRLFLSEVLIQLAPLWHPGIPHSAHSLISSFGAYTSALRNQPALSPLLSFISRLIRTRSSICRAILDIGFLEVVMNIRLMNKLNQADINVQMGPTTERVRMLAQTNALLLDIIAYPEHRATVSSHPLCQGWISPSSSSENHELGPFTTRERVLFLNSERDLVDGDSSLYLALDLPSLIKVDCISKLRTATLVNSLAFTVEYDQALRVFLLRSPYNAKVALLSRIIKFMHETSRSRTTSPTADAEDALRARYRLLFMLKLISATAWGPSNRAALLDAGVIGFLVQVVQTEVPGSYSGIADAQPLDLPRDDSATQSRSSKKTSSQTRSRARAKTESETHAPVTHATGSAFSHLSGIPAVVCEAGLARLLGGPLARTSRLVGLIAAAFAALFPDDRDAEYAHSS